jgi:hypothetical protein
VTNSTATNASGPTNGPARCHAAPSRRPLAVVGTHPARTIVCSGSAITSNGAANAIISRCWTMWPVKVRSAADSSHGDDARTIAPTPATHAHSRHHGGRDARP